MKQTKILFFHVFFRNKVIRNAFVIYDSVNFNMVTNDVGYQMFDEINVHI